MVAVLIWLMIGFVVVGVALWAINNYVPMQPGLKQLMNVVIVALAAIFALLYLLRFLDAGPPHLP